MGDNVSSGDKSFMVGFVVAILAILTALGALQASLHRPPGHADSSVYADVCLWAVAVGALGCVLMALGNWLDRRRDR